MGDLVGHYTEKTRLVFLSHLYVFPFLCIVYYLFTVLTGRMGMVGLWLHFAVFLFVIWNIQTKPLDGTLTLLEWLAMNGETSFTFSLLTFSWSRPNKGKYRVANLACWLWKTNKSLSRMSRTHDQILKWIGKSKRQREEGAAYLGGVAVIKCVLHHQVLQYLDGYLTNVPELL